MLFRLVKTPDGELKNKHHLKKNRYKGKKMYIYSGIKSDSFKKNNYYMPAVTFAISMPGDTEWLFIILGAALMYAWIKAIIEIVTGKFSSDGTKIAWLLVVICLGIVGAIIYMLAGRQSRIIAS